MMTTKVAIRDDDVNFFTKSKDLNSAYSKIWNICPITLAVVPFMKGRWIQWNKILEEKGPGILEKEIINQIKEDAQIYRIGENIELVEFVKKKLDEGKLYLALHGIHHRNEDNETPNLKNNFGIGAEFLTDRDFTSSLAFSIQYLEEIFFQKIEVFTPPQNLLSYMGFKSIKNNKLNVCTDIPSLKSLQNIFKYFGFKQYIKIVIFKMRNKDKVYPYLVQAKGVKMISHHRFQVGTNISNLYKSFDHAHSINANFVVSTHSYAFNFKMDRSASSMGQALLEFIEYAKSKNKVEFVNLKEVFI